MELHFAKPMPCALTLGVSSSRTRAASHQLLITSAENGKRLIRAKWINSNVPHALINFHCTLDAGRI
jgi:hypothetical protein